MNYRVTKLDRRYTGSGQFKYYISPKGISTWAVSKPLLHTWRMWCWEQWGASGERDWCPDDSVWAWDTEHHHLRIYLKGDKELSMFHLKWG